MSAAPGEAPVRPADLPERALLVAPTAERAAALGVAFEHAVAATPADLPEVLAREGAGLHCAAVTGVGVRGGRLATVVEQVIAACPADVQLLLDVADPVGWSVLEHDGDALRGLALVDHVGIGDATCLRFRRSPEPDAVPALSSVRQEIPPPLASAERLARAVDAALGPLQAGEVLATIDRLQAELAEARAAASAREAELRAARRQHRAAVRQLDRMTGRPLVRAALAVERLADRGPGVIAGARPQRLAAGMGGAAGLLALGLAARRPGGGRGLETALLAAVVAATPVPVVYARRSSRRLAASLARLAKAVEASAKHPAEVGRPGELAKAVAELAEQVAEIQRHMAVVAATTVDTSQRLARVAAALDAGAR